VVKVEVQSPLFCKQKNIPKMSLVVTQAYLRDIFVPIFLKIKWQNSLLGGIIFVMKTLSNRLLNYILGHKVWSIIFGLIILSIGWYVFLGGERDVTPTFVIVEKGTLKEEVSVTGNVIPFSDVNLAFERGGRVASIPVVVGDKVYRGQILASVSNADLEANLAQARANLKKALAQYQDVKTGTRAEEIILQETQVEKSTLDLVQAKASLVNTIKDSYTKADDAVRNKMYSLFTDPIRYGAKLTFSTESSLQEYIEDGKNITDDNLNSWYRSLEKLDNSSDLENYYKNAESNLASIKSLLDKCAEAVNALSPDSSIEQTQIDTWKSNVSTARTSVDSAIGILVTSYDTYKTGVSSLKISQDQLAIKKAGSTSGELLSAEASYEAAEAAVSSAEAELAKSMIKSPIDGVVTNIDAKLGEIVSANVNVISVISYGDYEVEAFVPEADISKIKIGNKAKTTLDAYGSSIYFDTEIVKIDPASTIIEGVPTYKITLSFITKDDRIRSGMTANLDILTAQKDSVVVVPARAVYGKNGDRYVKIIGLDNTVEEIKVTIGLRGTSGDVEILTGVKVGDKVVTSL